MAQITDDMILEVVIFDGTPSKDAIYRYIQNMTGLSRSTVVSKTGKKLQSLVDHRILRQIDLEGRQFYCFPDTVHPAPRIAPIGTKSGSIRAYLASLPAGTQFSATDIQDKFQANRVIVYTAIKATPGITHYKTDSRPFYVYVKDVIA